MRIPVPLWFAMCFLSGYGLVTLLLTLLWALLR